MSAFIQFHTQDAVTGEKLPGAFISAQSPFGPWQAVTNDCGDFFTPPPGLAPGHYDVLITHPGYTPREWAMDLADAGQVLIGLEPSVTPVPPHPGELPLPAPTREEVCRVRCGFQGETAVTQGYGTYPVFGPETTTLSDADLDAQCAMLAGNGWTHGEIAISWQYDEPGFLMPVPGRDLTQDLPELARRIVRMLQSHKVVMLFLAGDGLSRPPNPDGTYPYNDPTGHTYGWEWLMHNFPRIADYLKHSPYGDLTKYILFMPGYDGVFYGWGFEGENPDRQPDRVVAFGELFREVLPDGYLGIEHTPGKIPVGEGGSDWVVGGRMMNYDVVLSEFFWPVTGDQVWQIVARLNRPYNRPPDQPAGDDLNPPFYLAYETPRGPVYYAPFEYATYQWTRGQVTKQQVLDARAYFAALGCRDVC